MSEPCAVCGKPLDRDVFQLPVRDKEPVSVEDALRGLAPTHFTTVFVHTGCVDRARDEFQPYRCDAPKSRPNPTWCPHCESEISPDTCHCGEDFLDHGRGTDPPHSPVPMGCVCHLNSR